MAKSEKVANSQNVQINIKVSLGILNKILTKILKLAKKGRSWVPTGPRSLRHSKNKGTQKRVIKGIKERQFKEKYKSRSAATQVSKGK